MRVFCFLEAVIPRSRPSAADPIWDLERRIDRRGFARVAGIPTRL